MSNLLTPLVVLALLTPVSAQEAKAKATDATVHKDAASPKLLKLGEKIDPRIVLTDIDGAACKTADFVDRITVVTFWSTKCPIMQGWEDTFSKIHADYADKGVTFLMVNSNEANGEIADREPAEDAKPYQKIRDYLAQKKLPYRVLPDHDGSVAETFAAKTTPHVFVFNKKAELVYSGLIDDDQRGVKGDAATHYLRDRLDTLLLGRLVKPMTTRPMGCGIKRARGAKQKAKKADR